MIAYVFLNFIALLLGLLAIYTAIGTVGGIIANAQMPGSVNIEGFALGMVTLAICLSSLASMLSHVG